MRLRRTLFSLAIVSTLAFASTGAVAQQDASQFPGAALRFLGDEMPQMESAITERNRDYFEEAMTRVIQFSDRWGYKTRDNPALAPYAMCTDAVSDFLVVGMCRILTTSQECDPNVASTFNTNLQRCKALAGQR